MTDSEQHKDDSSIGKVPPDHRDMDDRGRERGDTSGVSKNSLSLAQYSDYSKSCPRLPDRVSLSIGAANDFYKITCKSDGSISSTGGGSKSISGFFGTGLNVGFNHNTFDWEISVFIGASAYIAELGLYFQLYPAESRGISTGGRVLGVGLAYDIITSSDIDKASAYASDFSDWVETPQGFYEFTNLFIY